MEVHPEVVRVPGNLDGVLKRDARMRRRPGISSWEVAAAESLPVLEGVTP
jgi:hypothetical protein